jgi:CelD/BcsL family acetyltransferase involved in cellulose biosynthesis
VDGFDRPGYSDYFWLMTDRFTWPGPLLVAALELDGKVLSGGWHFVSGGRFVFFLTSFEGEEWRYFSPGRLLIENLIEWSFSNAISVFDFTIGDEAYKFEYADQKLSLFKARIPVSVLGKAHDGIRRSFAERSTQRIVKRLVDRIRKTI